MKKSKNSFTKIKNIQKLLMYYYKTGHAVSFSSVQKTKPTKLPTHVKGAWQVTLSRWPNRERDCPWHAPPLGICQGQYCERREQTLPFTHYLLIISATSGGQEVDLQSVYSYWLLTTRKMETNLWITHWTMAAIDLQSVYSYLLWGNGNEP